MNAEETDQQACNTQRAAQCGKKLNFMMPQSCPTAGHERIQRQTQEAHTGGQGQFGGAARWPHGALVAESRRTQADNGGHMADKVWMRGQSAVKADTWRTSSGNAAGAYLERIAASAFC